MRKYIIGALFGFALAFTLSANAATIGSLVGKSIQAEFPVSVNGKQLDKKAIVIDGASYVPLRVIGDALGYTATFDANLGITFKKGELTVDEQKQMADDATLAKQQEDDANAAIEKKNADNESAIKSKADLLKQNNATRIELQNQLTILETQIDPINQKIVKYQGEADINSKLTTDTDKMLHYPNSDFTTWYKQFTDLLDDAKAQAAVIQPQIDALQKQLDDLNTQLTALSNPTPSPSPVPAQ